MMTSNLTTGKALGGRHLTDRDIRDISESLSRGATESWSRIPRIYVVLDSINQLQAIDAFLDQDISDLGFPFTQRTLPGALSDQTARKNFLENQKFVLSQVLEFERGSKHYHFSSDADVPLLRLSELGRGGSGYVDRVRSEISFREYARKLIRRGQTFQKDRAMLREFENELQTLKKLTHLHIVELVGSYTDSRNVGIIMSPVADCNLEQYFIGTPEPTLLRTYFGCLAVAVRFLHENCIRHKDIKPSNVLVYRGNVLLTDFGISRDWSESGHSTSTGPTSKTPRYCAPEVADYAPRNSSSDIWSLGCVFLEMWTVISGSTVDSLTLHLRDHGQNTPCYYLKQDAISSWCNLHWPMDLKSSGPLEWIKNMLRIEQSERWTAQKLVDTIQEHSESGSASFVGHCCDINAGSPATVQTFEEEVINHDQISKTTQQEPSLTTTSLNLDGLLLNTGRGTNLASSINDTIASSSDARSNTRCKRTFEDVIPGEEIPVKRARVRSTRGAVDKGREYSTYETTSLPNSFLLAQKNRLSRDRIMEFISGFQSRELQTSRLTRSGSERIIFFYGDYMSPAVVYKETCILSKPSSYVRWSTLKSLAQHMTPAILKGYIRVSTDESAGMANFSTIIETGSATDAVHGMAIFGWHDSHDTGRQKYDESDNYFWEQTKITVQLENTENIEVPSHVRLLKESERLGLKLHPADWKSPYLISGAWQSVIPKSIVEEDRKLSCLLSPSSDNVLECLNTFQDTVSGILATKTGHGSQERNLGRISSDANITSNIISKLFYSNARYFILKSKDDTVMEASLTHGTWSCSTTANQRLSRAFQDRGKQIILLLLKVGDTKRQLKYSRDSTTFMSTKSFATGLHGIGIMNRDIDLSDMRHSWSIPSWKSQRFPIHWISKQYVPLSEFSFIRVKHNKRYQNESSSVVSSQDGTEISLISGAELLSVAQAFNALPPPEIDPLWKNFENRWSVLVSPDSTVTADLELSSSINLESKEGDYAVDISNDGKLVAGGCKVVEVFDPGTGIKLWQISNDMVQDDEMHGSSFSPDSKYFAAAGEKGIIYIWDVRSGRLVKSFRGHTKAIFSLEHTANGSHIVSGSEDGTIRVWDAHKNGEHAILPIGSGSVTISTSSNCSNISAGTLDGNLVSWTLDWKNTEATVNSKITNAVHRDSTFSVQYVPGVDKIVTGCRDHSIKLWPTKREQTVRGNAFRPLKEYVGHKDSINSVDVSQDGKIIFSASGDGTLRLWDIETAEPLLTILGYKLEPFFDLSVCKSEDLFATASRGEGLQIWRFKRREREV